MSARLDLAYIDLLDVARRLGVEPRKAASTQGGEWAGPCPICGNGDDRLRLWPQHPSGRGKWWCRQCNGSGDVNDLVRQTLGLSFPEACRWLGIDLPERPATNGHHPILTVEALAAHYDLLPDLFTRRGVVQHVEGVAFIWRTADGQVVGRHIRRRIEKPEKGDEGPSRWRWDPFPGKGVTLFGAECLTEMRLVSERIVVCESEVDALVLRDLGLPAVAAGGDAAWQAEHWRFVRDFGAVVVWAERDDGDKLLRRMAETRPDDAPALLVAISPDLTAKDPAHLARRHGLERAGELVRQAVELAAAWEAPDELSQLSRPLYAWESWESSVSAAAPKVVPFRVLREMYSGEVQWLIPGYIARGELTLIPGPPESLKSWAMADLARAMTQEDGRWLGHFDVPQGRVLYVEQERARNLVYQLERLEVGYGIGLDGVLTLPPCGLTISSPEGLALIEAAIKEHNPLLVIINSLRSVYRGRLNDGADMSAALGPLGLMAERHNIAVLLVDQVNKPGGLGQARGMAGHADTLQKEFEADCVLHIERDRDAVGRGIGPARIYVGKRRHGEAGAPFTFALEDSETGGVRVVYRGETTVERPAAERPKTARDRVLEALSDQPQTPKTIARLTGLPVSSVSNTLTALKQQGEAEQPRFGQWTRPSQLSQTYRGRESWESSEPDEEGEHVVEF